jgi:Mor transcription activator family.
LAYSDDDYWYDMREKDLSPNQRNIYMCVGYEAYELLVYNFGGKKLYIPSRERVTRREKHQSISSDYHKARLSVFMLADKYRVSKDVVRKAIKQYPEPPDIIEPSGINDLSDSERRVAKCIGFDEYSNLIEYFGGTSITIQSISGFVKKIRHRNAVEDCEKGQLTVDQIAERHNLSRHYVLSLSYDEDAKAERENQIKQYQKRNKKIIRDYYTKRVTYEKLAEIYKVSPSRIAAIVEKSAAAKKHKRAIRRRNDQIMRDFENGLTYREIAKKHGITPMHVGTIIYRKRQGE